MLTDTKTLLLVDDEPANLQVLRNILSDQYRLLFAKDGERALELSRSEKPDLVLLDVMMPGLDGWQVLKSLRAQPETEHIPVLMQSMLHQQEIGKALGADDYLTKPVDRRHLAMAVQKLLPSGETGHLLLIA